jgi:hypothetical protein
LAPGLGNRAKEWVPRADRADSGQKTGRVLNAQAYLAETLLAGCKPGRLGTSMVQFKARDEEPPEIVCVPANKESKRRRLTVGVRSLDYA